MKRIFLLLVLLAFVLMTDAQSVSQVWIDAPDSLVGYLSKGSRIELIDSYLITGSSNVKNRLDGRTRIDTLTRSFMQVEMSEALTLQIKLLPSEGEDSVLCVVRTYRAPARESVVDIYSLAWEKMYSIDISKHELVSKPDTMSEERYSELLPFTLPRMVSAVLSVDADEMKIEPSVPFSNPDVDKEMKALVLQRKLKWNKKTFN